MKKTTGPAGLREWDPWSPALSLIPSRSLVSRPLSLTCLDACPEFVAFASDQGVVFWYDRRKHTLQRLRCSNPNGAVTAVKIASTVDFMVAVGNDRGQVDVFQIPKPHADSVPEHLKPKASQVERYAVGELHKNSVTCLEWSKNGTKLFSGDKDGIVVLTEIDFYMHICKSSEIINETYEIVQLSFYRDTLMVSSVNRAILCQKESSKWSVNQIGKKDRKSLCRLGGVFLFSYEKPNDVSIYSARPGLRLWTSDRQGNVLKTLLFKEAAAAPSINVDLINPSTKKSSTLSKDSNFGPLYVFQNKYLVSYNEDFLYILDPEKLIAIATIDKLKGIQSIAVNKDEIFVLQKDKEVVRIAYCPDVYLQENCEKLMSKSLFNPIEKAIHSIKNFTNNETKKLLPDFAESRNYIRNILNEPTVAAIPDDFDISNAEECFELPPVQRLSDDIEELQLQSPVEFTEIQSDSSQTSDNPCDVLNKSESPGEILHSTKKYKRKSIVDFHESPKKSNIEKFHSPQNKSPKKIKPDVMTMSFCGPSGFIADDTSPETMEKKLSEMQEKLEKLYNFETVTICKKEMRPKENIHTESHENVQPTNINTMILESPPTSSKAPAPSKNVSNTKSTKSKTPTKKIISLPEELTPQCVSIPGLWNLQDIKIKNDTLSKSETGKAENKDLNQLSGRVFDADWEII